MVLTKLEVENSLLHPKIILLLLQIRIDFLHELFFLTNIPNPWLPTLQALLQDTRVWFGRAQKPVQCSNPTRMLG